MRFGERLEIDISVDPETTEVQVPNFILQPLVENAIKHGVASIRGRASLSVAAERDGKALMLSVTNTCVTNDNQEACSEGASMRPRTGIGLGNIRQRLVSCYGDEARLETGPIADGYRAVIRLPLLKT